MLTAAALLPPLLALYDIPEITALTIDFFTVVFGFVIALDVIMQQPLDVSEQPAPQ